VVDVVPVPAPQRGIFANRTLNLRSVEAIGYDMDYTLIPYRTDEWEGAAFAHARVELGRSGLRVDGLHFEPDAYIQGLVIDLDTGNLLKATRFGYVIQGMHGTTKLSYDQLRRAYAEVVVDLAEPRFRFLNTLFSISEASLYAQLVDRLDAGELTTGPRVPMGYDELYREVSDAIDKVHLTGALKSEIISDPDRFCSIDDDTAEALLDQRLAGKRLLLITNSEWTYTHPMMRYAFDRSVGSQVAGGTWRDLFDIVVVAAAKPRFFSTTEPSFRMVDPDRGLFIPHHGAYAVGEVYHGGCAEVVETSLGLVGDQILYVGDHLFGDVHISKSTLRWRTALILREIEAEIADAAGFADDEESLRELMAVKIALESQLSTARLEGAKRGERRTPDIDRLYGEIARLDERITPLAIRSNTLGNPTWGPLMRTGSDKSLFARQVEKYADVYTSRVANFAARTPYAYLRATRTNLPHDTA